MNGLYFISLTVGPRKIILNFLSIEITSLQTMQDLANSHGRESNTSLGAPRAMRNSLRYMSDTSESELDSESSSQSESEEPPRPKNWKYEFPYYFDEGNDDSSSQAFSQEMNGDYEVESIVHFKVEKDSEGVNNALWCVCWKRVKGRLTPLNDWEPTKHLSYCKNAVAFFIAMLKDGSSEEYYPPSSRLAPALRAAEAGHLLLSRKEDELVYFLKGIDTTPRSNRAEQHALRVVIERRWNNLSHDSRENVYSRMDELRFECPVAHRFITQPYSRERQIERFPAVVPKPLYDSVYLNKNNNKEEDKYPPKKEYLEDIHPDTEEIFLNDPVLKPLAIMAPRPREDNELGVPRTRAPDEIVFAKRHPNLKVVEPLLRKCTTMDKFYNDKLESNRKLCLRILHLTYIQIIRAQ
ncbi:uncharacterized protein GO595_001297 [Histomonas meleagridis]|uniref:uncharacterized protein n=1 Tax=Histomonas meleagridis TaxID=135588 RepID=UPI0035599344|nr:hypothetical protein GO595_001297 [Histomonas meleagridis]